MHVGIFIQAFIDVSGDPFSVGTCCTAHRNFT